ncbi:enoyl-CoA hydratase-related protein [Methylomarinum vadi]|uniref:enoyl-CoA hydratase-related protein n=1 Tax=Methylomarinum vadi TaxID=438855 RepID=UPI00068E1BDC|nr:enoyl-CoA hydratase-related protein [Methylomarinum vadi]
MKILLISNAFSGLTQRYYAELNDAGYDVSVELHLGNDAHLCEGVRLYLPDLIVCPFLTRRLPADIYLNYKCLIVHPGIKGERGPSSLDWAIQRGEREWGVTLFEATEEIDAGPIWSSRTFPVREATKNSLFNREVTQAAVECLWDALTNFGTPNFRPKTLEADNPDIRGQLRPPMRQTDRKIDWQKQTTDDIFKRIAAADGNPGVLDEIFGQLFYLFNAHKEHRLTGIPGEIIAKTEQSICRATMDGAIWIGHLKPKLSDSKGIKLPATQALSTVWPAPQKDRQSALYDAVKTLEIDYRRPGRQLPCQEVWYERIGEAAFIYFPFHNGGMSTSQCRLLLSVYQHVAALDIKAIVLKGSDEFWSNGIHLSQIEAAENPTEESWRNINALDDLICQIVNTPDKLTIAAVAGNASAGGTILAIAADLVVARDGVIFNPHYKNMGDLYGSEYWTYLLPKRVGQDVATQLTEQRLPISAKQALRIGLVDKVLADQHPVFAAQVRHLVETYLNRPTELQTLLSKKGKTRSIDESTKPLASYRKYELTQIYGNFYNDDNYHHARQDFVFKTAPPGTPSHLAKHRQDNIQKSAQPGSMVHFMWQDSYAFDDEKIDREHKDFFELAEKLIHITHKPELLGAIDELMQHVRVHFADEEAIMQKVGFRDFENHVREHRMMLEQLLMLTHKIELDACHREELQDFLDKWTNHILHSDMAFNRHWKEMYKYCI